MHVAFKDKSQTNTSNAFVSFLKKRFAFLKNPKSLFYYFVFLLIMGLAFFATSLFTNYFTTPLTGDYTMQQYAFYTNGYDDWWHFFTTGQFRYYDTNTFLGASNYGSNSFYYLTDPFFFPILLFPRAWIPQGMAIITIFKMALAGLVFRRYIKYMGTSEKTARIAGFAYAFCGWISWYLWFNHFTGVLVCFAIVLYGVEKVLRERRPLWLVIGLFLLGLCNYFFFFTFAVCAFLYAMFRFFQRIKLNNAKENWKILGFGFMGFMIGALMASAAIIPPTLATLNSPRATDKTYLHNVLESLKNGDMGKFFGLMFDWNVADSSPHRNYYPIINFVFPVMSDRGTPLVQGQYYDNMAGSFFCYSPFIIYFFPAVIESFRKKKVSHIIAVALFVIMLYSPFFYYAFFGFTHAYARWNLFVSTSLITYVALYIDKLEEKPRWSIIPGVVFTLVMVWLAVFFAAKMHMDFGDRSYWWFRLRFIFDSLGTYGFLIIEGFIASIYVLLFGALMFFYYNKKHRDKIIIAFVGVECIAMGALTLYGHGYENYMNVNNGYDKNVAFQEVLDKVKKDDTSYYRCYDSNADSGAINDGMRHDYNGLTFFHSSYNYNINHFATWTNITQDKTGYSGALLEKRHNLDTFLGVKYHFVYKDRAFWHDATAKQYKFEYYRNNMPLGYVDISNQYPNDLYYVYRNDAYVELGMGFNQIATYQEEKVPVSNLLSQLIQTDELFVTAAVVEKEVAAKYAPDIANKAYNSYQSELDISSIPSTLYKKTWYDIHGDSEESHPDASSATFVPNLLDLSSYPSSTSIGAPSKWKYNGRYVCVIEPKTTFPYDEKGISLYLKTSYKWEQEINAYITVIDDNGNEKFYTFDNHGDSGYSLENTSLKNWRGFYVSDYYDKDGNYHKAPRINKLIVVCRHTEAYNVSNKNFELYYDSGTDYYNRIANLQANAVTDVEYRDNHFGFKTNYTEQKVVVTRIPYEKGWTIIKTDVNGKKSNVDVFTAQGGFVSFLAEPGEYTYSMDYYTAYMKEARYITAFGQFLFLTSTIGYVFLKEFKEQDKIKKSLIISR